MKNKHLTSSSDSFTNPESSNDNTHFRRLNSGFVDSGFEKLSDEP